MQTPKVHLYSDNRGRAFRNGAPGVMANTLCRSNHTNYETTTEPAKVTCRACLRKLPADKRNPNVRLVGAPVPRTTVEELARQVRALIELRDKQQTVAAQMVRACIARLRSPDSRKRAEAIAGLEQLAELLENTGRGPTPSE